MLDASVQVRTPTYAVEVFAGMAEFSRALHTGVGKTRSFDNSADPDHDILQSGGLATLLCSLMDIRPGAALDGSTMCYLGEPEPIDDFAVCMFAAGTGTLHQKGV